MLKLEFVPAAGDKLVLKLSPPPPLADKQASLADNTTVIDSGGGNAVGIPSEPVSLKDGIDTGTGGTGTASTGTGNVPSEGEPGPLKDGIDAGGGNVAGELSPMKSFAKVGIVPADDGRITLVISASVSPSLLGAKACGVKNVEDISVAKSGTDDVLKKEKVPDAGAVDSDKAKAMFAAHAPRRTAVFWSKFPRPTGPPTAPTGAVKGALEKDIPAAESGAEASVDETGAIKNPALKPATKVATALKPAAVCGVPSIKEFPDPAPAGDAEWPASAKKLPEGISEWTTPSKSRRNNERKEASAPIHCSNGYGALLGASGDEGIVGGADTGKAPSKATRGSTPSATDSGATVKPKTVSPKAPKKGNPKTTTTATPKVSVSASGWLSWPKLCWHNVLCAVYICLIAVIACGGAFAYFSHAGSDSLLPSIVVPDATALPTETERGPLFAPFNPAPGPVVPDVVEDPNGLMELEDKESWQPMTWVITAWDTGTDPDFNLCFGMDKKDKCTTPPLQAEIGLPFEGCTGKITEGNPPPEGTWDLTKAYPSILDGEWGKPADIIKASLAGGTCSIGISPEKTIPNFAEKQFKYATLVGTAPNHDSTTKFLCVPDPETGKKVPALMTWGHAPGKCGDVFLMKNPQVEGRWVILMQAGPRNWSLESTLQAFVCPGWRPPNQQASECYGGAGCVQPSVYKVDWECTSKDCDLPAGWSVPDSQPGPMDQDFDTKAPKCDAALPTETERGPLFAPFNVGAFDSLNVQRMDDRPAAFSGWSETMSGMTYDTHYTGQIQCDTCKKNACGACWKEGGDINKLACANLDKMSYGHGVHEGQECGECVFLKCVDEGTDGGSCKDKSVFAHVRVDNKYAASPPETETSPHFFLKNWNDKGMASNYYQWKPNPDCKLTDS